jgi:hypothetical protein
MDQNVRDIVQKSLQKSNEVRAEKRLEVQSSHRNLTKADFESGISDKVAKTLANQCKSGKITITELQKLCEILASSKNFCEGFVNNDGCLHTLVGFITGQDAPRQLVSLQCIANIAGHGVKGVAMARAAGPYLVTLLASSSQHLAEFAATALANIAATNDKASVKVIVNQEAVPNLINLARTSSDNVQEASLLALYHISRQVDLSHSSLRHLTTSCMRLISARPPIHLLWLLFALSSHQELHNQLSSRSLLNTCLDIATYEIFQKCDSRPLVKVLTPVVRLLANLAAGPDAVTVCLNLVRHPDFPAIMTALLSTNYLHLCRETTWLFANIVNNESVTVQEEFVNLDLMDRLESHATSAITRLDPYVVS